MTQHHIGYLQLLLLRVRFLQFDTFRQQDVRRHRLAHQGFHGLSADSL